MHTKESLYDSTYADHIYMAETELSAFVRAVTKFPTTTENSQEDSWQR